MPIKVTLHRLDNANGAQRNLIERARANLERAVNHPEFRQRVLNAPYRETRFKDRHGNITTKKPNEIAEIILAGMERDTAADGEIDIAIKLANISRPTLGSTFPGRLPWRTAYWFVNLSIRKNDTITPARHLMHEWLHVAGFVHVKNDGPRPDVAYLVGDIVRDLLKQTGFVSDATEDEEVVEAFESSEEQILEEDSDDSTEEGTIDGGEESIPCPFRDGGARNWQAWVNAMPGSEPKLIVTAEARAAAGYEGRLELTHANKKLPPNHYGRLTLVEKAGAPGGWQPIGAETEAVTREYESVVIFCHDERLATISPVPVAE